MESELRRFLEYVDFRKMVVQIVWKIVIWGGELEISNFIWSRDRQSADRSSSGIASHKYKNINLKKANLSIDLI